MIRSVTLILHEWIKRMKYEYRLHDDDDDDDDDDDLTGRFTCF